MMPNISTTRTLALGSKVVIGCGNDEENFGPQRKAMVIAVQIDAAGVRYLCVWWSDATRCEQWVTETEVREHSDHYLQVQMEYREEV
jgi:hypothetical protein